jgi:hypothetical protein
MPTAQGAPILNLHLLQQVRWNTGDGAALIPLLQRVRNHKFCVQTLHRACTEGTGDKMKPSAVDSVTAEA